MTIKKTSFILAVDQGTTSSRALIFDTHLDIIASAAHEFTQHFPKSGWVEHDPDDLWQTTLDSCREALRDSGLKAEQIATIGLTNQRETTLVWERATGKPVHRAIVWQDRRTAKACAALKKDGHEADIQARTGLLLDPYFSATKISWILDNVEGARQQAENGELCFGTVDTYLLWRLTDGAVHATDVTNASRTLLMNLKTRQWDESLLKLFAIPASMLPEIRDNACDFGITSTLFEGAEIPVQAMVGDQQGALIGQACVRPGMLKSTYGTGCFALLNTGSDIVCSDHRLLSTVAYQIKDKPCYALEGSIFMAGATIQWLRDKLGIIEKAADSEELADGVPYDQDEVLIPAFTGLGAPYWEPDARAAIFGMTRNTGRKELAAAALRSVALQSLDLMNAMEQDGQDVGKLRADGGMTENNWFMQALADITGRLVERAATSEATASGAAFLAGLQAGLFDSLEYIRELHTVNGEFKSELKPSQRNEIHQRWLAAVEKVR